jgi:hypothetical protein
VSALDLQNGFYRVERRAALGTQSSTTYVSLDGNNFALPAEVEGVDGLLRFITFKRGGRQVVAHIESPGRTVAGGPVVSAQLSFHDMPNAFYAEYAYSDFDVSLDEKFIRFGDGVYTVRDKTLEYLCMLSQSHMTDNGDARFTCQGMDRSFTPSTDETWKQKQQEPVGLRSNGIYVPISLCSHLNDSVRLWSVPAQPTVRVRSNHPRVLLGPAQQRAPRTLSKKGRRRQRAARTRTDH